MSLETMTDAELMKRAFARVRYDLKSAQSEWLPELDYIEDCYTSLLSKSKAGLTMEEIETIDDFQPYGWQGSHYYKDQDLRQAIKAKEAK